MISDEYEIAQAKQTIAWASEYMHWINKTGPWKPRSIMSAILTGPRFRMPPPPIPVESVRQAEETLRKHGINP